MSRVATLHLRNVPEEVYEALKKRAAGAGRSLNAEAVALLRTGVGRRTTEEVLESIRRGRKRIDLGPDAPAPEELIRHDRDTR